ncbi:MAG TPA: hypothetical protein PKK18_04130 [Chitinophagales bacterium]|nr:hypothetical protein [Chitinophagales bacterium]HMW12457.1 hypothetical protein [Chitinophagales bacterium]HMX59768.1 hypothetical protein [Chitinophagales bacterium]HMY22576.1 hypothetical protein [Chitinophagales bacterium]HMZ33424.1 hypothetical protein [Chitinophagales bacterium]
MENTPILTETETIIGPELNEDIFDIETELSKPTQHRSFDFDAVSNEAENMISETETVFNDDIDTEKLKETLENKVADNFEAVYDSSTLAPAIIDGADAIIQQVFPILYEKTAFSEDERKLIKILAHKQKNKKETTLTDEDLSLMSACAEYENYIESLPFTENEKKQILKPLSELLKDVNLQTTPGNALIIAVLIIMIPRLMPIGINKFFKN